MEHLAPLILVDVDGVLNPNEAGAGRYRRHWVFPNGVAHRLWLDPGHGGMLVELAEAAGAELVWAPIAPNMRQCAKALRWPGSSGTGSREAASRILTCVRRSLIRRSARSREKPVRTTIRRTAVSSMFAGKV